MTHLMHAFHISLTSFAFALSSAIALLIPQIPPTTSPSPHPTLVHAPLCHLSCCPLSWGIFFPPSALALPPAHSRLSPVVPLPLQPRELTSHLNLSPDHASLRPSRIFLLSICHPSWCRPLSLACCLPLSKPQLIFTRCGFFHPHHVLPHDTALLHLFGSHPVQTMHHHHL